MKPTGPIPPPYADQQGELTIGGESVSALVERAGDTPLFVYDLTVVRARVARFRAAFPGVALHYAMKANPHPELIAAIDPLVDGLDVASAGEIAAAADAGVDPTGMSFAGPGKRDEDIAFALRLGVTINCESERQVDRALVIGTELDRRPRLAVRVNPDFELKGSGMRMGGGAKPFGVDAERVPALCRRLIDAGAEWRGLHVYTGSQTLDAEAVIEAQAATVTLCGAIAREVGRKPPLVNLGGGFGIPYSARDRELDVEAVGRALTAALAVARGGPLADTHFAVELGRWLVGTSGVYLSRVLDRKVSHGQVFLVVDGGMQHQLAATGNLGGAVRRNYPLALAGQMGADAEEEVTVVGCLCTPLDRLGDEIALPRGDVGDLIAVFLAGAYGLTASPVGFLSQAPARELLVG